MHTDPEVDAWLDRLEHPQKDVIAAVRAVLLAADPRISEGIKWNAGSFRTTEWFATFNVRGPRGPKPVTLVLHFGAKPGGERPAVADPAGMLTPLGKDRAAVSFADLGDVHARTPALAVLIRAWITEM